jgi:hypothetical protein
MGVKFSIKLTPRTVQVIVGKKLIDPSVITGAMEVAAKDIIERTQAGSGVSGPLPLLSPAYAKYKAAVGRNPAPDRTLTGALLKAIHSKLENVSQALVSGKISFQDGAHRNPPKAPGSKRKGGGSNRGTTIAQVAQGMQKLFPFFGLTAEERQKLVNFIRARILGSI